VDRSLPGVDENGVILKENKAMETLNQKLIGLEIDLDAMKNLKVCKNKHEKPTLRETKCDVCGEGFERNCDLEHHLESCHVKEKDNECNSCGKRFHLKWRLKKHVRIHSEETKVCHYYSNKLECPFQEIGCMFLHETSDKVEHGQDEIQCETQDIIEEEMDDAQVECNLCGCTFLDTDELEYHIEDAHKWMKNLLIH
jgi:hypothetical protein